MNNEEILKEINMTFNQIIDNQSVLKKIIYNPIYDMEAVALQKTQESLLANLVYIQHYLQRKSPSCPSLLKIITQKIADLAAFSPMLKKQLNRFSL